MTNAKKTQKIIAVPTGRLHEACLAHLSNLSDDFKVVSVRNADVIPGLQRGLFYAGFSGTDMIAEAHFTKTFQWGNWKSTTVPFSPSFHFSLTRRAGKKVPKDKSPTIATKYPAILRRSFEEFRLPTSTSILTVHGQAEVYASEGLADYAFSIVQTGDTLRKLNLREERTFKQSEGVIFLEPMKVWTFPL